MFTNEGNFTYSYDYRHGHLFMSSMLAEINQNKLIFKLLMIFILFTICQFCHICCSFSAVVKLLIDWGHFFLSISFLEGSKIDLAT